MPPPSPLGRYDIEETAATTCDKDIKKNWMLETHGPLAVTPAMMKVPDSFIPIFNIGDSTRAAAAEYDERTYAACGLAFIFNGTATYGDLPPLVNRAAAPAPVDTSNGFWSWLDSGVGSVTDKYAYFGTTTYVSVFIGVTSDGWLVVVPSYGLPYRVSRAERSSLGVNTDWDMLEHKCKHRCDPSAKCNRPAGHRSGCC
jgi:hypothetical protein